MPEIEIRPETAGDIDAIRHVNVEAFRSHPISRQTEHLIVEGLRDAGALDVSLVAVSEGRVVGHIAFSRAVVGDGGAEWFLLGPVAVLPSCRGRGIGSALVERGLVHLRLRSASGCVLVGDPGFYGRFGFGVFPGLTHEGVPHEYVLGLPFANVTPCGKIVAHEAFRIEPGSRPVAATDDLSPQRFYHGTRADLRPGDLIEPGYRSNYGKRKNTTYVYLTGTPDAAAWGAELAFGEGPGRIYVVEPTGPIMDDPNLTDARYPGNPTQSFRSREPLRVMGEVTDWQGHSPEAIQAMKDSIKGLEPIDD